MQTKYSFRRWIPLLCLQIALAAACSERVPAVKVESAEAAISPMLVGVASVFMKIENSGSGDDTLVGARTDVPGTIAELHDIQDGKMVKVDAIPVPRDSTVVLRPARFHVMIFKLPKDAREGYRLTLTLFFKKSGEKNIPLVLTQFSPGRKPLQN